MVRVEEAISVPHKWQNIKNNFQLTPAAIIIQDMSKTNYRNPMVGISQKKMVYTT